MTRDSEPAALALLRSGELVERVRRGRALLGRCVLCSHRCGVDRGSDDQPRGVCRMGSRARISAAFPHHGEEDVIRGTRGSGTIFLSGCSLHCSFCQNFEISHRDQGSDVGTAALARTMATLQKLGCHNWNFVTPTHFAPQIIEALLSFLMAAPERALPLVWNTSAWDSPETLALLDGVVDVYMPDMKFMSSALAKRYLGVESYPIAAAAAIREMVRQTGPAVIDSSGLLVRGVLVRHLVMPGQVEDSKAVLDFLARLGPGVLVNVMDQYQPSQGIVDGDEISRTITDAEWNEVVRHARRLGLRLV